MVGNEGGADWSYGLDWEPVFDDPGDAKGTIKGKVLGGVGQVTITRATVSLYQQNSQLRSKRSGETDDEYNAYVKSENTLVQQRSISKKGTFTFYNVPYKQSFNIVGSRNWRDAYYTIEVTGAEADDGDSVLYFAQKAAYNVKVDSENTLELDDFLDIGVKRRLITALSKISENNYEGVESPLSTYLTDVGSGKVEQTDAVIEGIKRGIWAERIVNIGAKDANDLLKVMLEGVANLVADAYKDLGDFNSKALTNAEGLKKKVEDLKDAPAATRKFFGITDKNKKEYLDKTLGDSASLLSASEEAAWLEKVIKLIKPAMLNALDTVGMSGTKADTVVDIFVKALRAAANAIQHNSVPGGIAKIGVPELVKLAVPKAHPLLFDNSFFAPCYTSFTKDYLKYSADKMQAWSRSDASVYKTDRNYTSGLLDLLTQQWAGSSVSTTYYKAIADSSDSASAAFGVAGTVLKQAAILEKLLKINKYIFNGATVIDPAVFIYWTGYNLIGKGVYAAYGEKPPSSGSSTSKEATDSSVIPIPAAAKSERVFKAVASTGSQLKDALNSVAKNLQDNEIGQAMEATGGNSDGNYKDAIAAWKQTVSLFLTQSLGGGADVGTGTAGASLKNLLNEDIESKILEADMDERLTDIYINILSGEYKKTTDSLYVAERNKCVSVINSLISKVDELSEEMDSFTNSTKDLEFLPAVALKTTLSSSDGSGKGMITKSSDEFTLRVQVRNISTVSVSGLSAELTVTSPKDSVKVSSGTKLTVGNGTLAADDGVDGSGNDEASVEWKIKYEGDLSQESILLEVNILENDETPSSFVTLNAQRTLSVDPTLFDKDLDFMDDEWEASYGLNTEKDDSLEDLDGDGLNNKREYDLGTKPNVADTDGDGISDGDEVNGTKTGFDTDPLKEDTDDDGAPDDSDGQPLDDSTTEKDESAGEPEIAVDKVAVTLTESEPTASVSVTNSGTSTLYWSAQSENDAIAVTNPSQKNTKMGSLLTISAPSGYDFKHTGTNTTTVTVIDVWGGVKDYKKISVTVQPGAGFTEKPTVSLVITDFKPQKGKPGTKVTITGENFSPTKSQNIVTFAGTEAKVISASKKGTELKVKVPKQAQTGYITVTVDGNTAESKEQFTVTTSK